MPENLDWVSYLASSFAAGPVEELLLVVLLVWLLRSSGHSWLVVSIAAIALRIIFHFYYGSTSIGMALWPLLVIYLYKRQAPFWESSAWCTYTEPVHHPNRSSRG